MDGAESPDEVATMDANDIAIREDVGEKVKSNAVLGVVKGGYENQPIGDIKVGVAGGDTLSSDDDR